MYVTSQCASSALITVVLIHIVLKHIRVFHRGDKIEAFCIK